MAEENMVELNKRMRAIPQDERERLIHESDNVVGYGRFVAREQQIMNQEAFKKPKQGDD